MLPKRGQSGRYPGPHSADQAPPENWLQISHEYCYLSININIQLSQCVPISPNENEINPNIEIKETKVKQSF